MYPPEVVDRLRFIRQAQALGLTLADIREIVTFDGQRGLGRCRRVRDLLSRHMAELDARLAELRDLRRTLRSSLAECERALSGPADAECPVVDSLERPAPPARKPRGGPPRFPHGRP